MKTKERKKTIVVKKTPQAKKINEETKAFLLNAQRNAAKIFAKHL